MRQSEYLRCVTVGAVVEDNVDTLALDDAHDGLVGAEINSYKLAQSVTATDTLPLTDCCHLKSGV